MMPYTPRSRVAVGVAHKKNPSLLKAKSAKHRFKFVVLSTVMVATARYLKIARVAQNNQRNKQTSLNNNNGNNN
jgi:hypothetical protein